MWACGKQERGCSTKHVETEFFSVTHMVWGLHVATWAVIGLPCQPEQTENLDKASETGWCWEAVPFICVTSLHKVA